MRSIDTDAQVGFRRFGNSLTSGSHKSYLLLKNIDLTNIKGFTYEYSAPQKDGEIEVRIGSSAGPVISRTPFKTTAGSKEARQVTGELIKPVNGKYDVYFIIVKRDKPNNDVASITSIQIEQEAV